MGRSATGGARLIIPRCVCPMKWVRSVLDVNWTATGRRDTGATNDMLTILKVQKRRLRSRILGATVNPLGIALSLGLSVGDLCYQRELSGW